jgi:signal transduction histidine kinase
VRRAPRGALSTVRVPKAVEAVFLRAQEQVARYFRERKEDPELGTISIAGERYILLRAASMSVEFFDLVTSLYQDKGPQVARGVASNLLFDVAHAIGKADARAFQQRLGLEDPIEKLSAGPVHFSYSGWAFVDIFPESRPSADEDYFLIYDHPYSFESDAWLKRGRRSEFPVCVMNAGYSSGWCEESFGLPLVAVEIECLAAGGRHCRFVMAPPSRIEAHLARHADAANGLPGGRAAARSGAATSVPEFFQRKRLEDELRQSHEGLERRVAERTAELSEANDRLQREVAERKRAEEGRDEFLSVAAHELKTPMTSLRGFAQLLLEPLERGERPDAERLEHALRAIDRQTEKLAGLVSQLLDISRLDAGRLVLERQPTDVAAIVQSVAQTARARTRRHAIEVRGPERLGAEVDPLRLEQVLTNLVENAIRYSPAGGPIEVELGAEELLLRVVVADHGLGVPVEHRDRIFDRFYQAHAAQHLGGMGLGLYISRQIVELHGGRIEAEFPPEGGTRVRLELPLAAGQP